MSFRTRLSGLWASILGAFTIQQKEAHIPEIHLHKEFFHLVNDCREIREVLDCIESRIQALPGAVFDRSYLDLYNNLNCKPDIESVISMNAKQICNVMAAWRHYRRNFCKQNQVKERGYVVVAPNKRMRIFLQHLTKWTVLEEFPDRGEYFYFGINPDIEELQDVLEDISGKNGIYCCGVVIVGTLPEVLRKLHVEIVKPKEHVIYPEDSRWDARIISPNKWVTSF